MGKNQLLQLLRSVGIKFMTYHLEFIFVLFRDRVKGNLSVKNVGLKIFFYYFVSEFVNKADNCK